MLRSLPISILSSAIVKVIIYLSPVLVSLMFLMDFVLNLTVLDFCKTTNGFRNGLFWYWNEIRLIGFGLILYRKTSLLRINDSILGCRNNLKMRVIIKTPVPDHTVNQMMKIRKIRLSKPENSTVIPIASPKAQPTSQKNRKKNYQRL